jgi:hypothetical protein
MFAWLARIAPTPTPPILPFVAVAPKGHFDRTIFRGPFWGENFSASPPLIPFTMNHYRRGNATDHHFFVVARVGSLPWLWTYDGP